MADDGIQPRRGRYFELSSRIAQLDNARLRSLLEAGEPSWDGKGNRTVVLGGSKVFVKRLPVTDAEYADMYSTRNVYDLPTYYNYGVGSYGFGVSRELVTHIRTTNWVLAGEIAAFPLMYHHRVIPSSGTRADPDRERHERYARYWGGSANIGRYQADRESAGHELVLFLEHLPHTLGTWLWEHPEALARTLEELRATICFLGENGIVHFDAHFLNVLTDGERAYLTDFGLALDRGFALTKEEESFLERHACYDYGEVLWSLGWLLAGPGYGALPEGGKRRLAERYGIGPDTPFYELVRVLVENVEGIHADGVMGLDDGYVASVLRYRGVIALMNDFYARMTGSDTKDAEIRHAELRRRLEEVGFHPGPAESGREGTWS